MNSRANILDPPPPLSVFIGGYLWSVLGLDPPGKNAVNPVKKQ
jgi:hypothetical protein